MKGKKRTMKLLKEMSKAEFSKLLHKGMETAKPYGAMCYQETVVVLEGILEDGIYESFDELEDAKDKIAGLESEVTELNKLIDKLIDENTDLKHFLEERYSAWK